MGLYSIALDVVYSFKVNTFHSSISDTHRQDQHYPLSWNNLPSDDSLDAPT